MNRILSLLLILLPSALSARTAQQRVAGAGDLVARYVDSLYRYRAAQDSLIALGASNQELGIGKSCRPLASEVGVEYRRLLLPPIYYRSVARHALSLTDSISPLDRALLALYLSRPALVGGTEAGLQGGGDLLAATTVRVDHTEDIEDPAAAAPRETAPVPIDIVVVKPNFWNFSGDYYLQFLQNYVSSNWYKGGESNYSMVGAFTLNANYNNKQKVRWDNKIEMKLGFQTSRQDTLHSMRVSENLLRLTSKLGLQASRHWYYTLQVVASTQFMRQWESNSNVITTDFLGPLNANFSLGMDYNVAWLKGRLTGSAHLAPLAYNFRYVDRLSLSTRYGIDEGRRTMHSYGSQLTVDLLWKLAENLRWKTRLYAYTTYDHVEAEWENTLTFQFNRYISSNIFVYPRFDDNRARDERHGYLQLKEYASVGFAYAF